MPYKLIPNNFRDIYLSKSSRDTSHQTLIAKFYVCTLISCIMELYGLIAYQKFKRDNPFAIM